MIYLTPEQVLFINYRLVSETGGEYGVRDSSMLLSALERPQASFDGKDHYPGIFQQAAALMHSLVNNHLFIDGNKHTGIASAVLFLRLNGIPFTCSHDEMITFTLQVASERVSIAWIAAWLKHHARYE
ncbi:MAG: type II toxin-antitoxin system death-on-curing family toxin [Anaerolineae bacterium]|jgi:death-on-curing protein|nr:type II toxin-antitoxin system death-on-curing family toxin [Anaerolineae bacterium]